MTTHLTARVAWHDDGWNGRVCAKPEQNTYCVGLRSYPGDVIHRERDLEQETKCAGKAVCKLGSDDLPPCIYSINAFGPEPIRGFSNPPDFFYDGAEREEWDIPPSTVCVWPYESMYGDEVYTNGRLDNDKRREGAEGFFEELEADESLIFYYANHSNPFTDENDPKYVIVGVSRVKQIGKPLFYSNPSDYVRENYAGGMIWARNVSSHYPNEGFRIPYHAYRDQPEILESILLTPEHPATCKYGARHLTDDTTIGMLEQMLGVIQRLKDIGDTHEDWGVREKWVQAQIARLWQRRGLYPGLLTVMDLLNAETCIPKAKELCDAGNEKEAFERFFTALESGKECQELDLTGVNAKQVARAWQLLEDDVRAFLKTVAVRIDIYFDQLEVIVSENRLSHGLSELQEIVDDPYLLSEFFVGDGLDDIIPWSTIDRGVFPSPELGAEALCEMLHDDPRRFRSLCVEQLRREPNQTFRPADIVLKEVNARLDRLPEWKRHTFSMRYFEVDREALEKSLVLRSEADRLYLYLQRVFEDERTVERTLNELFDRPEISLSRPIPDGFWLRSVSDEESILAQKGGEEYRKAVRAQADQCAQIFRLPLSVISGRAGTGKTTIIRAIVKGLRQVEGAGARVHVMTPTGKATDRVRAVFERHKISGVDVSTIHSFLASNGWLNDNLTFKRSGGKRSDLEGTIVIDETSMLDLQLAATFFRAIEWQGVKRLILVGDHNQLPPIGRGRVFSDVIDWMRGSNAPNLAVLETNMRQMENRIDGRGEGILGLAELFLVDPAAQAEQTTPEAEDLLKKVHQGGHVDEDLEVIFWDSPDDLVDSLIEDLVAALPASDGEEPIYKLWRKEVMQNRPERLQVLTPHRGELHGVDALNVALQSVLTNDLMDRVGAVDGVTLNDKVIQVQNRTSRRGLWAYDFDKNKLRKVELFNGEIGYVEAHNFDRSDLKKVFAGYSKKRLKRFQVKFARKEKLCVNYGRGLPTDRKGRYVSESIEGNLELAYAISIHKSQGSEFEKTFVVLPNSRRPLSAELLYTALTRAQGHCRLYVQGSLSPLLEARRKENAQSLLVSSSLFDRFRPVEDHLLNRDDWYESGKIHEALSGDMVRSKSEVIIANLLHQARIPFTYEEPAYAPDGSFYLPDFTLRIGGERLFWEHWGMLSDEAYKAHRDQKTSWYEKHFAGRLVETFEGSQLSSEANRLIGDLKRSL
ncbi:ATP-dependent DNA helicase [Aurantiacibacter sp. D1-12]|uniref:ATP-dependent DNA helicase n=1 Tax=Aurantiacibacter sp. D1-12 TaxID=2993658 RepID=UPI00237C640D|nr:AAA family ATPase [Aurantiacibacter sp. D1-12]MDE1467159.1 AAA family ATPase [Aurantiacibacter sp. D1-12]